ncbi:MAG: hypothetical protein ACO23N_07815 [Opitutales bacterium]
MLATEEIETVWRPSPRQEVALWCPAFELLYGGSKGGGKSDFLIMAPIHQILLCDKRYRETGRKQRGRAIIFRKNLDNLKDIIARCHEIYPLIDPGAEWNKSEKRWTLTSGYVIDLAHLDGPDDHRGYNGQEITALLIDQAEELAEDVVDFLAMNVRSKDQEMRKLLIIRYTANPGGPHCDWLKRRFIEGCRPYNTIHSTTMKLSRGRTKEITKAFVPAKLEDNKYLDEDGVYEANIRRLPPHVQRMYLEGDWNVVVGAFFSHVLDPSLHFIQSFPIPGSWPIKMGIDWGSSAPACCLWGARDPDGNVYIIDELYGPGVTGRTFGEKMARKFDLQKWSATKKYSKDEVYALIDRQARAKMGGDGKYSNAAAGIASYGFRLFDMNKDRKAGNEQTTERLLRKANGKPSLYIFKDRCPNLVRTLPALMSDSHDAEDVDTDGEDHAFDALKAILLDWPIQSAAGDSNKEHDKDVERWLRLAKERKARAQEYVEQISSTGYGD